MKTIKDLTPKIRAKIAIYKERCTKDLYSGKEYENYDRKKTVDYIEKIYSIAKQQKHVIIVAKDPIQYKIFFELIQKKMKIIALIFKLKNKLKILPEKNELSNELCDELSSELRRELRSELDRELRSELDRELSSELRSELNSELDSELYSKLDSELDSELSSELRNELCDELSSELYSELYSKLDSKLDRELSSELGRELDSELSSELSSELRRELRSELDRELDSELYSKLDSELHSELYSELHRELDSELHRELDSELYKNKNRSHWLFYCSIYSRVYFTWYKFIQDEFSLTTKKKEDLDWLYQNSLNNIARCFFTKGYVLVLQTPKHILRNNVGFHSITESSIMWGKGNMYYINGRKINSILFNKVLKGILTFEEFLAIKNEDEKAGVITMIKENSGNEGLLKFLQAVCVDEKQIIHESGHIETVKLFKTIKKFSFLQDRFNNFDQPYAWTQMECPSTGQIYLIDTSADFTNVIDSIKFHRPEPVDFDLAYNF